jgi:hypothetical protein
MTNPNFESMNRRELRDYMLANRNDDDAFRAYMDRLIAIPDKVWYPAPKSVDDLNNYPELLKRLQHEQDAQRRKQEEQD